MSVSKENGNQIPFIRELCKHKSEDEIRAAEENFRKYLLLIKRICERLELEEDPKQSVDKREEYCDNNVPQNLD
jgi:transcription initiation factor TFIIIB Brf1 subunit/transcription initiation factor TFIIB